MSLRLFSSAFLLSTAKKAFESALSFSTVATANPSWESKTDDDSKTLYGVEVNSWVVTMVAPGNALRFECANPTCRNRLRKETKSGEWQLPADGSVVLFARGRVLVVPTCVSAPIQLALAEFINPDAFDTTLENFMAQFILTKEGDG